MEDVRLGVRQVAQLLGRHPNSVRRYEARGILPTAARDPLTKARLWRWRDVEAAKRRLTPVQPEEVALG
jgi:DNA-binding transcriptional MerR regulator